MKPIHVVEKLAATAASDTAAKETIIRAAWDAGCIEFFEGARLCYDNYQTFGLTKAPEIQEDGNDLGDLFAVDTLSWADFTNLTSKLASRELSGDNARAAAMKAANLSDAKEWNLWYRRILLRDLRCNIRPYEINAVLSQIGGDATKYLIPIFGAQVATVSTTLPTGPQYLDVKLASRLFAVINKDAGTVTLHASFGRENHSYPDIVKGLEKMLPGVPGSIVLDGGFTAATPTKFAVVDVIPFADFKAGTCSITQKDRVEVLAALTGMFQHFTDGNVYVAPKKLIDFDAPDAAKEFADYCAQVGGVLIKNSNALYTAGTSAAWIDFDMGKSAPVVAASSNGGSDAILALIDKIAGESSKNAKESMVKGAAGDAAFCRVLEYTYNPFKTYGIIPARPTGPFGAATFDAKTWQILDELIARKLTGGDAREAFRAETERLTQASADLLWRIVRKDLRANFSESTINKAVKGLIPEFPYMRCSLPKDVKLDTWDWKLGVLSQEKADGMFANVDNEAAGVVGIASRQGSPFPIEQFPALVDEIRSRLSTGTQQHGELLVLRDGKVLPREIGNGILNSVLKGGTFAANEQPIYMIWDQIPLSEVKPKGKYNVAYRERLLSLVAQLAGMTLAAIKTLPEDELGALMTKLTETGLVRLIPTRVVHSLREAYEHYIDMLGRGKEGTVIKMPGAIWKDGTSKEQVKLKMEFEVDLEIVGFVAGNGKNESTFGSITCRTSDGLLSVDVSGYTDAMRQQLWKDRDNVIGKIMTVKANDIMPPTGSNGRYSLFLPRFVELRLDKTVADSLQRVKDQKEAAKEAAILGKKAA